jgi:TolB-like protein/Flp pilus assembly protein TadD
MSDWLAPMRRYFEEFKRRHVFRVAAAYLVVAWFLVQLASSTFGPLGFPEWTQRALIIAVAVGFLPACVLAWIFDLTSSGIVRTAARDSRDQTATPTAAAETSSSTPAVLPHIASIAILPFSDLSQAKDQDWFCDGLAEEIIDALCCVDRLRVASRTASFRFRDGSVDPREIGRLLNVRTILEGSVRKAGDHVRITTQLINADDGYHLWSETFDRRLEDIFAIQSEIARSVSQALKLSLTGPAADRSERYAPSNMEAYEYYLRGRQLAGAFTSISLQHAPQMYRHAIALDPEYAQAHAGLADVLSWLIQWRYLMADDALPEAAAAARRALELAPDLAEAHVAMGNILSLQGDNSAAVASFERALALNPNLPEAYHYFGRHCFAQGDYARAAELLLTAYHLRPDEYSVLAIAVMAVDASGDHARALELARQAIAGLIHQAELEPENARVRYLAAGLYLRLGDKQSGRPYIEAALRLKPDDFGTIYNSACYYSQSGEIERALDLLEQRPISNLAWIEHDPDMLPLRDHPRFKAILARLR